MRDLNYDLKLICRRNRDGSFATQADRERILALVANALHALGFKNLRATSLKPKHVERRVDAWWEENAAAFARLDNLRVLTLTAAETAALESLAARSMALTCTVP